MPYKMTKVDGYKVSSPHGTKAKKTSKVKAQAQVNLLQGTEHGWKPTGKAARYKRKRKKWSDNL